MIRDDSGDESISWKFNGILDSPTSELELIFFNHEILNRELEFRMRRNGYSNPRCRELEIPIKCSSNKPTSGIGDLDPV